MERLIEGSQLKRFLLLLVLFFSGVLETDDFGRFFKAIKFVKICRTHITKIVVSEQMH